MSRRYKKEVKMIDMSARMNVEIVPATEEELRQADKEIEELNQNIESKMKEYSSGLSKKIMETLEYSTKVDIEESIKKDTTYFIEKYECIIEKRNTSNVQNRINLYQEILQKKLKDTE